HMPIKIRRIITRERLKTYFENMKVAMQTLQINERAEGLHEIIDWVKRYYSDAEVFAKRSDFVSALAAIAYCEGILEALRLLGLVSFSWKSESMKRIQ
ncbi:MAG: DUF357 domain-containing protein, partial [Candidatus Bathyarchaeia archaeon]